MLALLLLTLAPWVSHASMVRLITSLGPIDIVLYDAAAPVTVANFLAYVNSGAYNNSFIHRSVPGFIIQGGGYTWVSATNSVSTITAGAAIVNEFSASRSNLRGTVAMAKVANNPNSATDQWFVNLANNSANLDSSNGGFTVFGNVTTSGLRVVDAIAALPTVNAGGAFTNLPAINPPTSGALLTENVVVISSAAVIPPSASTTDSDRLFNYLEAAFSQYLPLPGSASANGAGYYYRYYASANAYVGTANGMVYYLVPSVSGAIGTLGTLADWLAIATAAGY
jgi:cyclophilin family peptidyl-prolyl cis-trans isomerase